VIFADPKRPRIPEALKLPFPEVLARWDANEIIFEADAPEPIQWARLVEQNGGRALKARMGKIPADAHEVPLVRGGTATPFLPGRKINPKSGADRRDLLSAIRASLVGTALADADPRVLFCFYVRECGYEEKCWNRNRLNPKASGRVYSKGFSHLVSTSRVWTDIPGATVIYSFLDGTGSFDGYPGFETDADAWLFAHEVFSGSRYGNARELLRIGGRDALREFSHRVGGVFSKSTPEAYERDFLGTWDNSAAFCGPHWVR